MQSPKVNSRIHWLDVSKGVGILSIIMVHTGYLPSKSLLFPFLSAFMLPVFLITHGFVFHGEQTVFHFLWKKLQKSLLPYYVIGLISLLGFFILRQGYAHSVLEISNKDIANSFVMGRDFIFNAPLWYLPPFFLASMMTRLIYGFWSKQKNIMQLFVIAVFIIAGFVLIQNRISYFFSFDLALLFVSFILFGKLISNQNQKIYSLPRTLLLLIIFVTGVRINGWIDMYYRQLGINWLFYLNACVGSVLIMQLSKRIAATQSFIHLWIYALGRHSFMLFTTHWVVMQWVTYLLFSFGMITYINSTPTIVNFNIISQIGGPMLTFLHIMIFAAYTLAPILFVYGVKKWVNLDDLRKFLS